jgi:hypothetical protein
VYYLVATHGTRGEPAERIARRSVTIVESGDAALDAVRALLTTRPQEPHLSNGFDLLTIDADPLTGVRDVSVEGGVTTVDLTRAVWDPYPNVNCDCMSGRS